MFGVFLTPPSSPEFDAGLIYIDGTEYSHMWPRHHRGQHGDGGQRPGAARSDGITRIRFETTAGLVVSEVASEGEQVLWTRFENVPAYVAAQDIPVELPGYGALSADIVWGGNYFGIVDLSRCGLRISPDNGTELSRMGLIVRDQLNARQRIQHPTEAHINNLNFITLWHEPTIEGAFYKNVHVFSAGQLDRSPGGTGTSAMMAMFEARGNLA